MRVRRWSGSWACRLSRASRKSAVAMASAPLPAKSATGESAPPLPTGNQDMTMATQAAVLAAVDQELEGSIARWIELLKIPSISTDPAYRGDCRKAGQWLVGTLKALGFDAALRDTSGHPVVVAHYRAKQRRPRVP